MKTVIIIISVLLSTNIAFGQNQSIETDSCETFLDFLKSKKELLKYIDNPCPNDSSCLTEIIQAKLEVASGRITFCVPQGLAVFEIRQEQQLRRLCKEHKINFTYEMFSDIGNRGQTQGCYGLYMDKVIVAKFGHNFKNNLLDQADSILAISDERIYWRKCDTKPTIPGKDFSKSSELNAVIENGFYRKLRKNNYKGGPIIFISFFLDKGGNPSGYFLSGFDEANSKNLKYKSELAKNKPGICQNI